MNKHSQIINQLKNQGERITSIRTELLELFARHQKLFTVEELLITLKTKNPKINKTTVYRELYFLIAKDVLNEVELGDGKKRYELFDPQNHHHHLICTNCKNVEHIQFDESGIEMEKDRVLKNSGFLVTDKILEFFGLCKNCQSI